MRLNTFTPAIRHILNTFFNDHNVSQYLNKTVFGCSLYYVSYIFLIFDVQNHVIYNYVVDVERVSVDTVVKMMYVQEHRYMYSHHHYYIHDYNHELLVHWMMMWLATVPGTEMGVGVVANCYVVMMAAVVAAAASF